MHTSNLNFTLEMYNTVQQCTLTAPEIEHKLSNSFCVNRCADILSSCFLFVFQRFVPIDFDFSSGPSSMFSSSLHER